MSSARTEAPQPGAIRPFRFPDVEGGRLSSGMELRVATKSDLPLVTAMLVLDAGESRVAPHQAGLAVLSGDALEGGTTVRNGPQLARALEGIGVSFGSSTGWDSTTVAVSCMVDHLPRALGLLSEMAIQPSFEGDEFSRYQAQRLATMAQRAMNPGSIAADQFARWLYREGDPYGRPVGGTVEAVQALAPDHARDWVQQTYRANTAGLVIVGDVTAHEARAAAEEAFCDWPADGEGADETHVEARSKSRVAHIVHRGGAVQSEIRIGHVGLPKGHPDELALKIFNLVLGGSFTSRLNLNLRERNGFTYGIRSGFTGRRGPGPFSVSTAVGTEVTSAAVKEILIEVERLVEEGPTREEVAMATNYLAGVFPLRLETTGRIAGLVAETLVYGLPDDYYQSYRDRVRDIDLEQAHAAGRRHVRPQELCTLIVGDAKIVGPTLAELDLGPVARHEATGGTA